MMTKQNIFSLTLLLGSLLMGGCVSTVDVPEEKAAPISFATTMTRAAVDADRNNMESFLVWGGFNNENNLFHAETVTPHGNYTGTRYWVSGETHNFYALHPAGLTEETTGNMVAQGVECTNAGVITVTGFDTSLKRGTEAIDLMTASQTGIIYNVEKTPSPVNLTFSHELSRVKFTISTDAKVRITHVSLKGIAHKGDFTTQADAASPWNNLTKATENDTPFSQSEAFVLEANDKRHLLAGTPDTNDNYGDLLLIPQTFDESVEFMMTWVYENNTTRTVHVPLPQVGPAQWEKGKSYHYQATIPSPTTDISFTVTITDWNDRRIDADL